MNFLDTRHFVKWTEHQINLYSHLVVLIWDLGLNYLIVAFNGYDSVPF